MEQHVPLLVETEENLAIPSWDDLSAHYESRWRQEKE